MNTGDLVGGEDLLRLMLGEDVTVLGTGLLEDGVDSVLSDGGLGGDVCDRGGG